MNEDIDLTISIVNYNTKDLLRQCISSIIQNTTKTSYRIVVVDNASKNGSAEIIQREFPTLTFITNKENKGFAAANNQALRIATGKYIILLNPDIVVLSNALDKMVEFMKSHGEVGGIGAKLLNPDGSIQRIGYYRRYPSIIQVLLFYTLLNKFAIKFEYLRNRYLETTDFSFTHEVQQIPGACLMVRREVIEQVGLLDEDFFIWFEDVDWCYRITKAGWKLYYYAEAEMIHYGGASFHNLDMSGQFQKSLLKFFQKNHKSKAVIVNLIFATNLIICRVLKLLKNLVKVIFKRRVL